MLRQSTKRSGGRRILQSVEIVRQDFVVGVCANKLLPLVMRTASRVCRAELVVAPREGGRHFTTAVSTRVACRTPLMWWCERVDGAERLVDVLSASRLLSEGGRNERHHMKVQKNWKGPIHVKPTRDVDLPTRFASFATTSQPRERSPALRTSPRPTWAHSATLPNHRNSPRRRSSSPSRASSPRSRPPHRSLPDRPSSDAIRLPRYMPILSNALACMTATNYL